MFSFKRMIVGWNNFFFTPKPTEGIATFRIVWCSLLFANFFMCLNHISDFYGPHAIISEATVKTQFNFPHLSVFNFLGTSYQTIHVLMIVYGIALLAAIIGYQTRWALIIVMICLTSLHQRNIWINSSSETLMRITTLLLIFSPAGHSLSIDSLIKKGKHHGRGLRDHAPWALRLIQIQLSVVYVWTVWQKLKGETWLDGTALYYATRLDNFKHLQVPYLFDSLFFIKIGTWATLILELALGTLIWFKEFRKPLIYAGIIFHLGIEYAMSIPFFEIVMISMLLNFFTPEEYRVFIRRTKHAITEKIKSSPIQDSIKNKILYISDQ
jgi:hypothetical protein